MTCIFCRIAKKELPADIVWENDDVVVFKDINPKAAVHLLVVPKDHIESVNALSEKEGEIAGKMIIAARKTAERMGFKDKGYKLVFNVGRGGGQIVDHIHLHILAGNKDIKISDI